MTHEPLIYTNNCGNFSLVAMQLIVSYCCLIHSVLDKFSQPFLKVKANNADSVILRCQIPNMKPRNLRTVRWSKKDFQYTDLLLPLEDAPHYTVGYNGDLYFSYVTTADSGSYVCVVGNTMLGRTEKRTLKLAVAVPIGDWLIKFKWLASMLLIASQSVFAWLVTAMLVCQLKRILVKFFCLEYQCGCFIHRLADLWRMIENDLSDANYT